MDDAVVLCSFHVDVVLRCRSDGEVAEQGSRRRLESAAAAHAVGVEVVADGHGASRELSLRIGKVEAPGVHAFGGHGVGIGPVVAVGIGAERLVAAAVVVCLAEVDVVGLVAAHSRHFILLSVGVELFELDGADVSEGARGRGVLREGEEDGAGGIGRDVITDRDVADVLVDAVTAEARAAGILHPFPVGLALQVQDGGAIVVVIQTCSEDVEAVLLSAVEALENEDGLAVVLGVHIVLRSTCHSHLAEVLSVGRWVVQSAVIVAVGIPGDEAVEGNVCGLVAGSDDGARRANSDAAGAVALRSHVVPVVAVSVGTAGDVAT